MAGARTLICPNCNKSANFEVAQGWSALVCPSCKEAFRCLIASVRGKRSRGNKKFHARDYSVRVLVNGNEKLIEFTSKKYYDFEMRSKDEVAFLYMSGEIYVLHNFTINESQIIRTPTSSLAVIFAIIVAMLIAAYFRHWS